MEFSTQIMATPVSANTAIHMLACPARPRIITAILITRANITFCHAMRFVFRAMAIDWGIASTLEFINTASAASIAASAPLPMAAPTSAPRSTGASLIPTPTNRTVPCAVFSYGICTVFGISGKHNCVKTEFFQGSNGFFCIWFDSIGDQHISCKSSVYSHKYFRAVRGFF